MRDWEEWNCPVLLALYSNKAIFRRPGQEEGNIPFVEDAGFGKYSGEPSVIADTVSSWLASPEKLQSMQKAALNAARPEATLDIARDLAAMAFAAKKVDRPVEAAAAAAA